MKKTARLLAGAMVAVAAGCGGSTRETSPNQDSGASGGSAGSSATAGRGGGGSAGGGAGGRGGSAGSTGSAGNAGTGIGGTGGIVVANCNAPPESYECEGGDGSFYFDAATRVCRAYGAYRCSFGQTNRFPSMAACLATCAGARPDVDACQQDADCVIVDRGCCAACEPVPRETLLVVNRTRMSDFRDPCQPIGCGQCPPADELVSTRQYFVPTCNAGRCEVFDIRNTSYTECSTDTDCGLRDGAQCCEGCDGRGLVSLNKQPLGICRGNFGCPACAPIIPPEFAPKCQEGHCRVTRTVEAGAPTDGGTAVPIDGGSDS